MKRNAPLPLLLILSLILALFVVPTLAQAAPSAAAALATKKPSIPTLAPRDAEAEEEDEFELEAEEIEIEECEAADGTFEFEEEEFEGEEAEDEEEFEVEVEECEEEAQRNKKAGAVTAPEECRVQQAESSITTLPSSDRVELTVRYQTYKPSTVSLGLKLKDGKGSLKIEDTPRHLGKKGVLHLTTKVSDAVMDRAATAREFTVSLRAPKTPGYCGNMLEQQLQAKHPVGNARVYTQRVNL
jgi:Skp family chaperone for outer membrane proteins